MNYTSLSKSDEEYRRMTKYELIREFYYAGYNNKEIVALLSLKGKQTLSCRQIRRITKSLGLSRRSANFNNDQNVRDALTIELGTSGKSLGSRAMKKRLLSKYGLNISRQKVASYLQEMDPEGVYLRSCHRLTRRVYRNEGPNYLIHIDGYDKLKRYGFAIHGGICGFSRRILWLKVNRTNNNPKVVAGYFHEYLNEIKGVPRCIRGDRGTENCLIELIQKTFRSHHFDDMNGDKSYISGKSTSNQRIERWWLSCKQGGGQFWIDYFKDLESLGVISTADTDQLEALRFCYTQLIQADLDQCRQDWNQHFIRQSNEAESPAGKPDIMFFAPELYGTVDYKTEVAIEDIDSLVDVCEYPAANGCEPEVSSYFKRICLEEGRIDLPAKPDEALELFNWLISFL